MLNTLELASPELQNDKDVVLEAVKKNNKAIKFASKRLQLDEEVRKMAGL